MIARRHKNSAAADSSASPPKPHPPVRRRRFQVLLARHHLRPLGRLGVAGLLPAFALAFFSLTQPWARARVVLFWGVARSPEAALLLLGGLAAAFVAGAAVAWTGRRAWLTAWVHLGTAALLGAIAWQAYRMIRDAGVHALGFVPIASVRTGRGLHAFAAAALWLLALGLLELTLAARRRRRRRAAVRRGPATVGN